MVVRITFGLSGRRSADFLTGPNQGIDLFQFTEIWHMKVFRHDGRQPRPVRGYVVQGDDTAHLYDR